MRFSAVLSLIAASMVLIGCRTYSPVERHFMRVPAMAAAAVSTPDRGKWIRNSRKVPGFKATAMARHWMPLVAGTRPRRVQAAPREIGFFPETPGSPAGMVALNWQDPSGPAGASRLWLLRTHGGRYIPVSLSKMLPEAKEIGRFTLMEAPGTITAWKKAGTPESGRWIKAATLTWSGKGWKVTR